MSNQAKDLVMRLRELQRRVTVWEPALIGGALGEAADAIAEVTKEPKSWQPFATAPVESDGPAVLLCFGKHERSGCTRPAIVIAYWDAYYAPGGVGYKERPGCSPWVAAEAGETIDLHYSSNPTHWMPLPEFPS